MKQKKQLSTAMLLLAAVWVVCYKGMRAIEEKLTTKKEKP